MSSTIEIRTVILVFVSLILLWIVDLTTYKQNREKYSVFKWKK